MAKIRGGRLFRDTVIGLEAVGEGFAVLIRGVFCEQVAVGGALEGLEARLALDRLGGSVLRGYQRRRRKIRGRKTCGFQLAFRFLASLSCGALAFLLCSIDMSVPPHFYALINPYLAPLPMAAVVGLRSECVGVECRFA
jgi:hypothetical protein